MPVQKLCQKFDAIIAAYIQALDQVLNPKRWGQSKSAFSQFSL